MRKNLDKNPTLFNFDGAFNQHTLEDINSKLEDVLNSHSNVLSCVYGDALNIKLYIAHK